MPPPVIGIDLGTTYARVAVVQHGKVKVIANKHGNRSTPSCVAFTNQESLIGEDAVYQATQNPENTIFSAKRMIGRHFKNDELLIEQELGRWQPKFRYDGDYPNFSVKDRGEPKLVPPAAVSAMVLTRLKQTAEAYLGQAVTEAVISVPANFYIKQRQATQAAGSIAGLEVRRIINEPTAAALAYGLGRKLDREQTVLVFDLGGGTLDVSILTVADGVYEVLATAGNTRLGGADFDYRLVQYFSGLFKLKHDMDLGDSPEALIRLIIACEEAKRTLSSRSVAYIKIDSLYRGVSFYSEISRDRFNELCDDLFQDTLGYVLRALEDAKLERSSIDEVILVGGSTRIPKIRHLLQNLFDGKRLNLDVDTDEAVACGAAAHAALLSGDASLGADGHVLVDVVPFSWGVSTDSGFFKELIERNSRVPIQGHLIANMIEDYQTEADIGIYEGQHRFADNNSFYFVARLNYCEPAPQSAETRMVIVFDVDLDGILRVGVGKTTSMASSRFHCFHWKDQKGLWIIQTDSARLEAETEEASVDEGTGCREEGKSEDDDPSNREGEQKGVVLLDGSDAGDKDGDTEEESQSSKEVCAVRSSNPCGQPQSVDQLNQQQHDEEPPVEEVADDVLFVIQALLDAEPRTSPTERLEIYYRCAAILAQVHTTSRDLRVTHRCSELNQLLRQNYGDAAGSYADDIEVPGLAMPSLYDCLIYYLGDVLQASMEACDAGTISHDDTRKVNNMAADLLDWTFDDNQAGAYELLWRIKKLQSTCKAIDGLQIPSDDFKKGTDSEDEGCDGTESTESTSSEDDDDDETESKDSDDDGDDDARQNSNDLPPLEEVF